MQRVIRQIIHFNLGIPGSAERPELYRGQDGARGGGAWSCHSLEVDQWDGREEVSDQYFDP